MQEEFGAEWIKPWGVQKYYEASPTRLLATVFALSVWLGWIMREKHDERGQRLSSEGKLNLIAHAFNEGVILSRNQDCPPRQ